MGYTKDLWMRSAKQPDGSVKREPTARHGKGKRWLANWTDPDGRERSQAFKVKAAADKKWRDMESDRDRGQYYDPKAGQELFANMAARWLASRVVDPSSQLRYRSLYELHIRPVFGRRQVKSIKPSDVQAWQAGLGERFGISTVATARLVLLGVLDLAVADDLIRKNPARASAVQRVSHGGGEQAQAWGDDRVNALIDAHPDLLRLLPILGSTCGLREGEAFGLALEDVDFDEHVIRVRRQIKKLGAAYVYAFPKSDKERTVPLADWTAEYIRAHVAKHPPTTCSLPWEKPDGSTRTHNLLSYWFDGGHVKARNYSETVWKPALVSAGVIAPPTKDNRGRKHYVTTRHEGTHQLRHYYASVLLADGVSIKELAEYLGHTDPGFTLRVYEHMLPDSHDRARRAIDARRFRPRAVADGTYTEQVAR
jgi:integrase